MGKFLRRPQLQRPSVPSVRVYVQQAEQVVAELVVSWRQAGQKNIENNDLLP